MGMFWSWCWVGIEDSDASAMAVDVYVGPETLQKQGAPMSKFALGLLC
jgi:hypothetical protein